MSATTPDIATAVVVFAKAPVPGAAKTRLAPVLGDGGAAVLAARLLKRTLETVCEAGVGPVTLYCAPDVTHDAFTAFSRRYGLALAPQGDGDLGERMHRALVASLDEHDAVLLVGADIPLMAVTDLTAAAASLRSGTDVVLGPAEDGGYWLIGARRTDPRLFEGMPWSSPDVYERSCERVRSLGWGLGRAAMRRDVDRPEDLAWLAGEAGCSALVDDLIGAARRRKVP